MHFITGFDPKNFARPNSQIRNEVLLDQIESNQKVHCDFLEFEVHTTNTLPEVRLRASHRLDSGEHKLVQE